MGIKNFNALVTDGPGTYRIEPRFVNGISDDDILMKIYGCGICPADLRMYYGDWKPSEPRVHGHEFYGRIEAIGDKAAQRTGLAAGDFIAEEQIVPCGQCRFCLSGHYWMCQRQHIHGFAPGVAEGGMAQYIVLNNRSLVHKLPITRPDPVWAMVEPLGCAIHAVDRAGIEDNDVVVLAGLGSIGLCMLQVAKLKKPRLIIALDTLDIRLKRGLQFGADIALNPAEGDVVSRVKEITDGYGCDKYINSSGSPQAVVQGLTMLRKLGTYVEFSVFTEPASVNWSIIGDRKEVNIHVSHLSPFTYPLAIEYIASGAVDVKSIVTHVFQLGEFEAAFEVARDKEGCLKVVLEPHVY